MSVKGSFAEAAGSPAKLPGVPLGVHSLEQINQNLAASAPAFRAAVAPPPAVEEGPILVVTTDGKAVPMRRPIEKAEPQPHHRRTKGEKANKKRMACVGAVYGIAPFVRDATSIVDEVIRHQQAERRLRPRRRVVWAEMSRDADGLPVTAKEGLFRRLWTELTSRNLDRNRPGDSPLVAGQSLHVGMRSTRIDVRLEPKFPTALDKQAIVSPTVRLKGQTDSLAKPVEGTAC